MNPSILAMHKPLIKNASAKIIVLWTVFLLGTLFHTQLALMPLFHNQSVVEPHAHDFISVNAVMWFMTIFFSLPLLAIIGCAFYSSGQFRRLHFGMTLIYTILNLLHFILDSLIAVPNYQLILMGLLFCVGLMLNWVAYQWQQAASGSKKRLNPSI